MRTFYFAYGSNLKLSRIKKRCDAKPFSKATLHGYRLTFKGYTDGVADVVKCRGKSVDGALYEVTESDLKKLDKFEGVPYKYKRVTIPVMLPNGNFVEAIMYKMQKGFDKKFPRQDYYAIIKDGYEEWGLCYKDLWNALVYTTSQIYSE